jgi:hypothetical protein
VLQDAQLAALGSICDLFDREGIEYWLFGGWAVDFHAGRSSRAHDDLDLAVWARDHDGRGASPEGAFGQDVAELGGVRARVIRLDALKANKSEAHDDPRVAAKDRADLATLEAARQE